MDSCRCLHYKYKLISAPAAVLLILVSGTSIPEIFLGKTLPQELKIDKTPPGSCWQLFSSNFINKSLP